jgi:multiple sugar transport system substrate-binding protein
MISQKKRMKKYILPALLAIVPSISAHAQSTITFWVRDSDQAIVDPLVKAYNARGATNVKLSVIPAGQFVTKFATSIAGGTPPDVVAIDLIYLPAFSKAGQMTELTAQAKALPFFDKLSPSHVRLATYEGKLYAVPFSAEASVLVYNKDLFKRAGLDPQHPPANFAEIEQDAQKITSVGGDTKGFYFSGSCAGCNVFTMLPLIWASGGDILSEDGKTATLDNNAVRSALSLYRRMWQAGFIPQGGQGDNGTNFFTGFATGKVGMAGLGAFAIGLLKEKYPNINFDVAPLPGQNGGSASFAGGDSIGIPKGSKKVKEAWEFIQWCLQDDTQINEFAKNGSIPVRTDIAESAYAKLDPRYVVVAKAMATGKTPYSTKYNELLNDPNGPWLGMVQTAVFGKGVDEAVKEAQEKVTKILNAK